MSAAVENSWANNKIGILEKEKTDLATEKRKLEILNACHVENETRCLQQIKNLEIQVKNLAKEVAHWKQESSNQQEQHKKVQIVDRSLQQKIEAHQQNERALRLTIHQLEQNVIKLQQENYELQGHTSNLADPFPTIEQVLNTYAHFGHQTLVGFIVQFENKVDSPESFVTFVSETSKNIFQIVEHQYNTIINLLFPGSLSSLANSQTTFNRELLGHFQQNYKQITSLDSWCEQRKTTFNDHFIPQKWQSVDRLVMEVNRTVRTMHDICWQIILTKKLKFGKSDGFASTLHNNPFSVPRPVIVLPHLTDGEAFVAMGFAY